MSKFQLVSPFKPTGDQPQAIEGLVKGLKRGEKHQVLHGVTGSGKSVVSNTPTLLKYPDGSVNRVQIGTLIDNLFGLFPQKIEIINGSDVIIAENLPSEYQYETYSFDPLSKSSSWKPILQFIRHDSPHILFQVETSCGRNVTVTGDHNFFVLRDGNLQLLETEELVETDFIPVPLQIDEPADPIKELYLPTVFSNERKYYVSMPTFAAVSLDSFINLKPFVSKSQRAPLPIYRQLVSRFPNLACEAKISAYNKIYEVPLSLQLNNAFLRLMGYYIAEGHATKGYIILSSGDDQIIQDFQSTLRNLGFHYFHRPDSYDYQVSSALLRDVLKKFCGGDSASKQLPDFWPQLNSDSLAQMLSAYFSGDGGVDGDEVTATTASQKLASDLQYALLRFGIVARVKKRKIKLPGKDERRDYWCIRISGKQFLEIFQEKINFVLERKRDCLKNIIHEDFNTNVDIIPVERFWLGKIREELNIFQRDIADAAGIERSYISMLESGVRKPSRTVFAKLIEVLEEFAIKKNRRDLLPKIQAKKQLLELFWTPVKKVIVSAGEKYVYDFAIEENETFLAGNGGLFVHNTFAMSNVIQAVQKPTLVIAHNKTLAAQLCSEFKEFFPNNAVSYFVSYYDYYQPEAYIPTTDTYIEKDSSINEEINKYRHAATVNLLTRRDVLIVASVSCIYGLGDVADYSKFAIEIKKGDQFKRDRLLRQLSDIQFTRSVMDFKQGMFHVLGDTVEIFPSDRDTIFRLEFFGDEIDRIAEADAFTGEEIRELDMVKIFPAKHDVKSPEKIEAAVGNIRKDMELRYEELLKQGKMLEAHRIKTRTEYDLEILQETGYVTGIENYTRYLNGRPPGMPPATLFDYFPDDFLLFVDESHMTIPQIGGMHNGNFSRKQTLVDYGFRLPSAHDNRPLKFEEFEKSVNQVIYVSATPSKYEFEKAGKNVVEQIIRPTGLIDPEVVVRPSKHQIDDILSEIHKRVKAKERVLLTTLTKRSAEDLTDYLTDAGVAVRYLHSDIDTLERIEILRDLRLGKFDVLVGINLLREGLDLPEVSFIAILDADKEGFLRSEGALIQTIGRAARNVNGFVIMYANRMTDAMKKALSETERRRGIQEAYNKKHGITPQSIVKAVRDINEERDKRKLQKGEKHIDPSKVPREELGRFIRELEQQMDLASQNLEFEKAAELRDEIEEIKTKYKL